jgi:hypothetical protein
MICDIHTLLQAAKAFGGDYGPDDSIMHVRSQYYTSERIVDACR